MSHHSSLFDSYSIRRQRPPKNKIGTGAKHDSAISHVMGTATYVDDMLKPESTLHLAVGKSAHAHARVLSMDLSAVRAAEGVIDVITFKDLPAKTDIGAVFDGVFKSMNNRDEEGLMNSFNPLIGKFLGKTNATRSDVATFLHKIYKNDVASMTWMSLEDYKITKKEIGDQQYEYTVAFSALRKV